VLFLWTPPDRCGSPVSSSSADHEGLFWSGGSPTRDVSSRTDGGARSPLASAFAVESKVSVFGCHADPPLQGFGPPALPLEQR
jgi:hypothetical protein